VPGQGGLGLWSPKDQYLHTLSPEGRQRKGGGGAELGNGGKERRGIDVQDDWQVGRMKRCAKEIQAFMLRPLKAENF
jgi:hypothetical protein